MFDVGSYDVALQGVGTILEELAASAPVAVSKLLEKMASNKTLMRRMKDSMHLMLQAIMLITLISSLRGGKS